MSDTAQLETALNQMILGGQIMEAFERFYAEDVVMQEGDGTTHAGKDTNRSREQQFVASVATFHSADVVAQAIAGDVSFSEWRMDVTFQDGNRTTLEQVAVRRWRGDQVVHERFYYNAG